MQDIDIGNTLYQIGLNVESVGRQLTRRRRDYSLEELDSLCQILRSNAGTIEALSRIQKREARINADREVA